MNPLHYRLATLRRRLRFVVTFRGACWLGSLLCFAVVLAGLLDWRVHLPGAVRAVVLAGTLGGAGYVLLRYLVRPLAAPADDLALALRVEARYPELNDALASAVQFLERAPEVAERGPPTMRREAVKQALKQAEGHDFAAIVDERGMRPAWLALMAVGSLTALLVVWQPVLARTALLRLADPFGGHDWPRQTQLVIQADHRAARGEAFTIRGTVRGVLPEKATLVYRFTDESRLEQACDILHSGKPEEGTFTARLEPERVQQPFRFQVRAHDAVSEWRRVDVLPPPRLAPLDGRPSPQVTLRHPAYSDLPDLELPDGATSIEALAGTLVTIRAATDRPVARAWLEFPPELAPAVEAAEEVASLGGVLPSLTLRVGVPEKRAARIPARVGSDGHTFALDFIARVGGVFTLHLEDETGLGSSRLFEVRVIPDPVPTVQLERPAKSHDSFDVLPGADVTLQVLADDPQFALRSVWVEYRVTRGEPATNFRGPHDFGSFIENGRVFFHDHATTPRLAAALSGLPAELFRLRPPRIQGTQRWSLRPLNLKEGDAVRVQAFADDFDDVTVGKPAGHSHEVELRVVGRPTLERLLHDWQTQVQQELQRLARLQQDALKHVVSAEAALKNQGKLGPKHVDEVVQAEQLQQQLRARVGSSQEGLRADIARILQTLRDNHLPRAGAQERMDLTAAELERLAREHLDQVEPRLTETRKDQEAAGVARPEALKGVEEKARPSKTQGVPPAPDRNPLTEARKHQEEIRRTLQNLLKLLEPWSNTSEVKGEARTLLEEQRRLTRETDRLGQDIPPGTSRDDLKREQEKLEKDALTKGKMTEEQRKRLDQLKGQQAALDRAAELQNKVAERVEELLGKMERAGQDGSRQDSESAKELREAAEQGRKADIAGALRSAEQGIRDAALGKAREQQRSGTEGLERMVQSLEERREAELDRLQKKLQAAEERLGKITQAQEELRKRTQKAAAGSDPRDRTRELRRLAREQEKLHKELEETLQELTRLRRPEAQRSAADAGGRMEQATRRLQDGADAGAQQEEALDRLDEARRDLQEARQAVEEELAREKLAKLADQIKGLKERQESRLEESARIHQQVLQRRQWTRGLLTSLRELGRTQQHLAKETASLADGKLAGAEVFNHLLRRSAQAMEQAAERVRRRADDALRRGEDAAEPMLDVPAEQAADEAVRQLQAEAIRRFDHLLDALKPDAGTPPRSPGAGGESGGGQGGGGPRGPGDGVPPVAELKALRSLQVELNERTRAFAEKHPDPQKLSESAKSELEAIQQEQQKIAELFHKITSAVQNREGEKP